MNSTACPTRQLLLAYHTGELPEESAEGELYRAEPECRELVAEVGTQRTLALTCQCG